MDGNDMNINELTKLIKNSSSYRYIEIKKDEVNLYLISKNRDINKIQIDLSINELVSKYFLREIPNEADIESAINRIEDELMKNSDLKNKNEDLYISYLNIELLLDDIDDNKNSITREEIEEIFTRYALISMGRSPVYDDIKMNNNKYAGLLILREVMHHLDYNNIIFIGK